MKKQKNRWLVKAMFCGLMVTSLSGCKKFLDLTPQNSLTRDEFFKTEADANSAITGVYDGLQTCVSQFLRWGEFRADLVASLSANDPIYLQSFDNINNINVWQEPYRLIGRANIVIEKVPEIPRFDRRFSEQDSKRVVAEALFLRSLAYFYLVRTFKDVPLVLEAPSSDAVNFLLPKVSADSILNQIESDLITAEADLPLDYGRTTETKGRATKAALNALQTDVYLWHKKYAQAAEASKKVLDNPSYQLVPADQWFEIFALKNSSESIFEVQFESQLAETNQLRNLSNSMSVNNSLYNLYLTEQDLVRGKDRTYREAGTRTFWKYTGLTTDNVLRAADDPNFIIYRLPDVMLMRAEALIHLGGPEKVEAVSLINAVRKRVSLDELNTLDETTPLDVFIDIILKERAMEFALEGKRWFDLVRFATNEKNDDILLSRVVSSRAPAERAQVRSRLIDNRSWYLPIHRDELLRNPRLVQNEYYR